MKAAEIIEMYYRSEELEQCIRSRFPADLHDDVRQDLFEIILKIEPELLLQLHYTGKLRFYIVRIILNLSRQERNIVYKNYRPKGVVLTDGAIEPPQPEPECRHEAMKLEQYELEQLAAFERLHWYERGIFEMWAKLGKLKLVSEYTGIPYFSLKDTVRAARAKARQLMEEI